VRSSAVVVLDVYAEDVLELAAAEDQHTVEAFAADGADLAGPFRRSARYESRVVTSRGGVVRLAA
jgi:hypothetical protein